MIHTCMIHPKYLYSKHKRVAVHKIELEAQLIPLFIMDRIKV